MTLLTLLLTCVMATGSPTLEPAGTLDPAPSTAHALNVRAPASNTNEPDLNAPAPSLNTQRPTLNKPVPWLNTHSHDSNQHTPDLNAPAPGLHLPSPVTGSPSPESVAWRWPLGPPAPRVLRAFSPPPVPWAAGHRGVDLAARPGQLVRAAGAGQISYAGRIAGQGVIAITHGPLRTTYLPVHPGVRVGRSVRAGARIGELENGPFHCRTACLHWGLLQARLYLDPLNLVRRQVRLLPFWSSPPPSPHPAPARLPRPEPQMSLRNATTATGGALTGLALAGSIAFAWRRIRTRSVPRRPHRPPPGVIDLARERRLRRTP
ncbi:peptidoglycan DD-metalloendopeptidase family protein [Actinomadura macra]|uniref:peptidoglycan DD-metalloendopeptidase family protein n=1 Tax=Actinomadura macra TaxID=46164 RepID=UPI000AAC569D